MCAMVGVASYISSSDIHFTMGSTEQSTLPSDFLWGFATAAYQIEGGVTNQIVLNSSAHRYLCDLKLFYFFYFVETQA
jgi:hypothetical protein